MNAFWAPRVRFTPVFGMLSFTPRFPPRDMEQKPPPTFPSPEELKTKIAEFMKANFGARFSFATCPAAEAAEPAESVKEDTQKIEDSPEFEFNLLPRDIKAH